MPHQFPEAHGTQTQFSEEWASQHAKKKTNQKKTHLFKKKNLRHSRRLSVWTLMRLWLPEIRPFKN
jgi:membrane protein YqaA with SNARE-associated domain